MKRYLCLLGLSLPLTFNAPFRAGGAPPGPPGAATAVLPLPAGVTGGAASSAPLLSADSRWVVFTSGADNLATNDTNGTLDIFAYDRLGHAMALVSVNRSGTASANGRSMALDMSTNGQWVLFQSEATDLVANYSNNVAGLFVRDLVTGHTVLASVERDGVASGGFNNASLSLDGRYVVFESFPKNLVTNTATRSDIYIRDLQTGSNLLVSVSATGATGGNGHSQKPVMSADGRWVAFQSQASNLAANDTSANCDIFLRDTQAGTNSLISVNPLGSGTLTATSTNPAISLDGRYVAFESTALNLATNNPPSGFTSVIYLRDRQAATTTLISSQADAKAAYRPVLSPDARYVAYESQTNLYCWDATTQTCFLMTTNSAGAGVNGFCFGPQFTPDGHYCVFLSFASDLAAGATNLDQAQVYRRDMETALITLASGNRSGLGNNRAAASPVISNDGRFIAFQSGDDDLVADDYNQAEDVFVRDMMANTTEAASVRATNLPAVTAPGRNNSWPNCLSADGRYLLFASTANHLVTNANNGLRNLFVRDLWTGSNQLVSASWDSAAGVKGLHAAPALSADGRWAVFQSTATNLTLNDTNRQPDVFLRDLWNQTNCLVSVKWTGAGSANSYSINPAISSNGQYIAFQSLASDLIKNDSVGTLDAFVRDVRLGTNYALSTSPTTGLCAGGQTNRGIFNPFSPLITPDGRWVLLWNTVNLTTNANLVGNPKSFAKSMQTGQVLPVGIFTNGSILTGNLSGTIAPGGRLAVFATMDKRIGIFDFASKSNISVAMPGWNPTVSSDGRWVAFESGAASWNTNSGNAVSDIFLFDRQTEACQLVSVNYGGNSGGNRPSTSPLLSHDARFVVFKSAASDLVSGDTNGYTDVFVRDLGTGTLFALSAGMNGGTGRGLSGNPVMGPDGRTVMFESFAPDLAPGDFNQTEDVFVLRLSVGDSDGDGMDDDWEMTYFGELSHDGTADTDGDGATDLEEFLAGTNPLDSTSVFRVISLSSVSSGAVTVFWNSTPGKTYRVEYKDALAGGTGWTEIPGDVFAAGPASWKADPTASQAQQRFYRVRLVD